MALKFLNKKGWHTGSLRNIENVWKAEQKRDAEDKKLEELRKQIHEERERSEFRQLQEQAGLVPKQERLDFLYESGLAVGKGSSDGFKALEALPKAETDATPSDKQPSSAPGALFEEKPQSANDAWRKLHSDPLLLIRQREQEALARIKNNPVQMAMIQKSVNMKKLEANDHKKSRHSSSKGLSDSKDGSIGGEERGKRSRRHHTKHGDKHARDRSDSETDSSERKKRKRKHQHKSKTDRSESEAYSAERWKREKDHQKSKHERLPETDRSQGRLDSNGDSSKRREMKTSRPRESKHSRSDSEADSGETRDRRKRIDSNVDSSKTREMKTSRPRESKHSRSDSEADSGETRDRRKRTTTHHKSNHEKSTETNLHRNEEARKGEEAHNYRPQYKHRRPAPKQLTDEEKAARLRDMQADAELHEEQRWKRLKKASEDDALEENKAAASASSGKRNFLDAAQKSIYGAERGGSSTIEESVRRQKFYLQGQSEGSERNAFRR